MPYKHQSSIGDLFLPSKFSNRKIVYLNVDEYFLDSIHDVLGTLLLVHLADTSPLRDRMKGTSRQCRHQTVTRLTHSDHATPFVVSLPRLCHAFRWRCGIFDLLAKSCESDHPEDINLQGLKWNVLWLTAISKDLAL